MGKKDCMVRNGGASSQNTVDPVNDGDDGRR